MSKTTADKLAAWLAVQQIVDAEARDQGERETRELLATVERKISLLRDSEHFVRGMVAFDVCSEAIGLVEATLRSEESVSWVQAQLRQNVTRAREEDIGSAQEGAS